MIYISNEFQRKSLDASLGFAAGVMIAASFWSLLSPAIELAESSGYYGADGRFSFVPVAGGFLLGAIFCFGADRVISYLGINSSSMMIALTHSSKDKAEIAIDDQNALEHGQVSFINFLFEYFILFFQIEYSPSRPISSILQQLAWIVLQIV